MNPNKTPENVQSLTIKKVSNGYIVRILKQDCSPLKELYEKPVLVFPDYISLVTFLDEAMD